MYIFHTYVYGRWTAVSIAGRIGGLVEKHLDITDRTVLDANIGELGVNGMKRPRKSLGRRLPSENKDSINFIVEE